MEANIQNSQRSSFSLWVQAIRPFAYSASVIPVLVGAMYALASYEGPIQWGLYPIVIIAAVLFHTGTNLVSEYFDLKKGVDREDTYGSSRILVDNLMPPSRVLRGGFLCFAIGFLLGLVLVYYRGGDMLMLGLIGLAGGVFYTGKPIGYKYLALGDIAVFMLMGPLMVIGSYFALTGDTNWWDVFYVSIPVGFLVAAILHANNMRDIIHDAKARVKTMAMLIGFRAGKTEYIFLVIGAYLSVIIMIAAGLLHYWTLIVLLSLPPALKNIAEISKANEKEPESLIMMDIKTAQHHMLFGLLYSIGLLLTALLAS